MQFHMMTLLDVLGKIALVRSDFLSQGKISDTLIRCARSILSESKRSTCTDPAKTVGGGGAMIIVLVINVFYRGRTDLPLEELGPEGHICLSRGSPYLYF